MTGDRDDRTLAGEYVLCLLEGAALAEAERRLASDAGFAREVEYWRAHFAAFDDTTEPRTANDELWRWDGKTAESVGLYCVSTC